MLAQISSMAPTGHTFIYIGLSAIMVLNAKIIFDWAKGRVRDRKNGNGVNAHDCQKMVKSLFDQHNRFDENGTPLWYVPRDMGRSMDAMEKNSVETNIYLKQILAAIKEGGK